MSRRWVINASPLILLGKIDRLSLALDLCDELIVPAAVIQEVSVKTDGSAVVDQLESHSNALFQDEIEIPAMIEAWDLGRGEAEVLAHASKLQASRAVVDDREARRCAKALDLGVIGTLGIVLRARRLQLLPSARSVVSELLRAGLYVDVDLVERALEHLGE